ncbi:protein FAR1-RELATED SEQUENCE 5-like [Camellia sinensis]|uniref:protein FAR1-RELATED SEQUENCE 5-like n=1 Tax=Camellia sinensis TaxID=4442 RepID=UPI001035EECE|nr:protein FAR1-RELATED SEQUENCE 5-like [Camellia sinensis]
MLFILLHFDMDMELENDYAWKPKEGMTFDSEQCAYDFYNTYRGRVGFSIRKDYCSKNKFTNQLICRILVCNKKGFQKLDNEEQITIRFWVDAQMIMYYAPFGDVVTFDTTYKLNKEYRLFASFVGFNHYRETVIFDAALLYDETAKLSVCLFQTFLEAMSRKAPKNLFIDQDVAMAKAIPIVMPDTSHRLCTWHLMQNALKHVNCLLQDKVVKSVLNKFMFDIEDENEWKLEWVEKLDKYDAHDNHWLKLTFTILYENRYKELEVGYALCQRLPKVKATRRMLIQMGNGYTKNIFEEFQNEYFHSIELDIKVIEYGEACTIYTVVVVARKHAKKVKMKRDDSLGCNRTKFERKGILCCHSLKVIRDVLKMKEVPSQYILKRWTKQARAKIVRDINGK